MQKKWAGWQKWGAVVLSAALFAAPWLGIGDGVTLFAAFVPLLALGRQSPRRYWLWVAAAFTLWNVAATWWVGRSTLLATFAIPVVSLFFTLLPFMLFHWLRSRAPRVVAWTVFVTAWIVAEKWFMQSQLSFPWLMLGNGFMQSPWMVQWYEWTGVFGGSLWVLVANVFVYEGWSVTRRQWKRAIPGLVWLLGPIVGSLVWYANYTPPTDRARVKVAVVQPNLDPYTEKFDGLTQLEQRELLLELADSLPPDVQFILTPETALEDDFVLNRLAEHPTIDSLRRFMGRYPAGELILGATTFRLLEPGDKPEPWTRTQGRIPYDVYNSAIGIARDTLWPELYHKSKLVVGVERMPYPKLLGSLKIMHIDLGGISGNLGLQPRRTLFSSPGGTRTGVAICYESVYGAYFAEYVRAGAQFMSIITNDGWWGNTSGHHQHFHYARLRAIETRRSIARSANTGISGFIDPRGRVVGPVLGWDVRGRLVQEIALSEGQTFYVRYGDYIVRIALLLLVLALLYGCACHYRTKNA